MSYRIKHSKTQQIFNYNIIPSEVLPFFDITCDDKKHELQLIGKEKQNLFESENIYDIGNNNNFSEPKLTQVPVTIDNDNDASNDSYHEPNVHTDSELDLICSALQKLEECNMKDEFITFFKLVIHNKFPLQNLALHLFLDVVRFHGLKNPSQMTYSPNIKLFWKTGQHLFKGKFLRFMGGLKHSGQLQNCTQSELNVENAQINFIVPSKGCLKGNDILPKEVIRPGLFEPLLDVLAKTSRHCSFKLCIDGKKINPA